MAVPARLKTHVGFRNYMICIEEGDFDQLPEAKPNENNIVKVYHGEVFCRVLKKSGATCGDHFESTAALRNHINKKHGDVKAEKGRAGNPRDEDIEAAKDFYEGLQLADMAKRIKAAQDELGELVATPKKKNTAATTKKSGKTTPSKRSTPSKGARRQRKSELQTLLG